MVGLLVYNAEELDHFRGAQGDGVAQYRCGGTLDGSQRRPQFVAYHGQEPRPHPLQFLEVGHVLQRDDEGRDPAVIRVYRGGVNEGAYHTAVGNLEDDFLGAYRLPGAESLGQ